MDEINGARDIGAWQDEEYRAETLRRLVADILGNDGDQVGGPVGQAGDQAGDQAGGQAGDPAGDPVRSRCASAADVVILAEEVVSLRDDVAAMRAQLRNMRFAQGPPAVGERRDSVRRDEARRDGIFFCAMRRRFAETWTCDEFIKLKPEHMTMLGHLLDLPAAREAPSNV
jgi:hypothetical protein